MIRFNCDYLEGTHPRIMEALMRTNMEQTCGYSEDEYCEEARKKIKEVCKCEDAAVHFLVGGTQANLTVVSSVLRPHQAVLSVKEGHVNVHESGAIEATGHKVMAIEGKAGKLTGDQIRREHKLHWEDGAHEHITQPKMVYISNPTELGTIYSKAELVDIRKACDECNLYLYLDGARLGYGLASKENDLTLEDIAKNCDVFYIGGTKVGALFGEAVVITNQDLQEDFRYIIKQKGGMLAKGRLLGIQFLELFKDGLYFEISAHAMKMAELLKDGLKRYGYQFYADSPTNQQFVIVSDEKLEQLKEKYAYEYQMRYDENHSVVRFCTSWATKEEHILQLLEDMKPENVQSVNKQFVEIKTEEDLTNSGIIQNSAMKNDKTKAEIYTDGAARGNPDGPGGYGTVIEFVDSKGNLHTKECSQGYVKTTNNRMELMAAIVGLETLNKPCEITLYSDSKYLVDAFNQNWIDGWIEKGWKRGKNEPVKNIDLWKRLLKAMEPHQVTFVWVKGHDGHPQNERCDVLATTAADGDDLIDDVAE